MKRAFKLVTIWMLCRARRIRISFEDGSTIGFRRDATNKKMMHCIHRSPKRVMSCLNSESKGEVVRWINERLNGKEDDATS